MFMVLVHPYGALSPGPSLFQLLLFYLSVFLAVTTIPAVTAQTTTSPTPTEGLSFLDSPAPNAVLTAGSNATISIDVSAGVNGTFTYNSLEVYLVSETTNINLTVASGGQLLNEDAGSDVKRIDWPVDPCLASGDYNLTLYEGSSSNGTGYFAITPIPVQVQNDGTVDANCTSPVNALEALPQPSSPPPAALIPSPTKSTSFTSTSDPATTSGSATTSDSATVTDSATTSASPTNTTDSSATITPAPTSTGGGIITVTEGTGEITIPLSGLPGTIVVEPSGGAPPDPSSTTSSGFITVFKTVAPTATSTVTEILSEPVTVTLEETFVSTVTGPGQTLEFTVTQTLLSTMMLVATETASPQSDGLLPINAASSNIPFIGGSLLWSLSVPTFCFVLRVAFGL